MDRTLSDTKTKFSAIIITSIDDKGRTIVITGKGGTGKTMLSTLMIKILAGRASLSVLAVDADSAKSLPHTLGMTVGKTVGGLRQEIIENPEQNRAYSF